MNIDSKACFLAAKQAGMDFLSVSESYSKETSLSIHNDEVESQQIGSSSQYSFKGIYDGKKGIYSLDSYEPGRRDDIISSVKERSSFGREDKIENYFDGKAEYEKAKTLREDFVPSNLEERRKEASSLSDEIRSKDSRIINVDVSFSRSEEGGEKKNSLGLDCKEETKYFTGSRYISAKSEDGVIRNSEKGAYSRISLTDLKKKLEEKIPSLLELPMDFFHPECLPSGSYPCVFSESRASVLLNCYRGQLSAKQVHKHLSLFEGKLNQKIRSDAVTILHTPHIEYRGSGSFDADGYPTQDFPVIEKGILKTYFYSLETAHEENKESNGCSCGNGEGEPLVLTVQKGDKSLDEIFAERKDGIYITELKGLNSGIDGQSLQFSLPCSGYVIKNGKKDHAFDRNIVSGNLKDLFLHVVGFSKDPIITKGNRIPNRYVSEVDLSGDDQ